MSFSIEFYPPKTTEDGEKLLAVARSLQGLPIEYISITCGAGGSSRGLTLEYTRLLHQIGFQVMPHVTCVGQDEASIRDILSVYTEMGIDRVMLLRGDLRDNQPAGGDFSRAIDLVRYTRNHFPSFKIGVAGYPEKHPEAPSLAVDIAHLKEKVDAGADFIITQLFFKNADYFAFVEHCRAAGIAIPIVPGLLPVLSLSQAERFCALSGSLLPEALRKALFECTNDKDAMRAVGVQWTIQQLKELHSASPHFYVLNRAESLCAILKKVSLGLR